MAPLFLTVFVDLVGFGIIIPFLPFFAESLHAAPNEVTLLMTAFSLAQFVAAPLWGRLSDRIGRKPVLVVTLLGLAAAYVGLAFAHSLLELFAARIFAGLMSGNIAVAQAAAADMSTPAERPKAMGMIGAAFGLGFLVGPAIGGVLSGVALGPSQIAPPAFAAASLSTIALILAIVLLKESNPAHAERDHKGRIATLRETFAQPRLRVFIVMAFLVPLAFAGVESTMALWTERAFGWGARDNGYLFSFLGLIAVLTQGMVIGRLSRVASEETLVTAAGSAAAVGLLLVAVAPAFWPAIAGFALIVFGISLATPAIASLVSRSVGASVQGTVMGASHAAQALARIAGPAAAGSLFVTVGPSGPYLFGALLMIGLAALALTRVRPAKIAP
ncbi:MAG TPA: MFS transporter [Alphaproteobacteria bacterium]|nr:MFS transporter [Alphaproteobacteria bacterium]